MNSVQMPVVEEGVAVVLIDVQERLARAMPELGPHRDPMIRFLQAAALLKLDLMVTEQYPQGLGPTIPELTAVLPAGTPVFAKTTFSCWGCAEFATAVERFKPRHLILLGVETHVCVQQTAIEGLRRGYNVILPQDAVCSRKLVDREAALNLMRQAGVVVTSVEAIVFNLLRHSGHPQFREITKLFK